MLVLLRIFTSGTITHFFYHEALHSIARGICGNLPILVQYTFIDDIQPITRELWLKIFDTAEFDTDVVSVGSKASLERRRGKVRRIHKYLVCIQHEAVVDTGARSQLCQGVCSVVCEVL